LLTTFTVTNFNDAGAGSLREAITMANAASGPDEIRFQSSGTVRISSQLPTITDTLSIFGPSPQQTNNLMTISGGHGADGKPATGDGFRLFDIDNGASTKITVLINFIRLTGADVGAAGGGGGAIRSRETLDLSTVTLFENAVSGAGTGGGAILNLGGSVDISNSTVRNNSAAQGPGGAIHSVGGDVNLNNGTTIAENLVRGGPHSGGGLALEGGSLMLDESTVRDNSTAGVGAGGGGIFLNGTDLVLQFSAVTGNFTLGENAHGGGIFVGPNQPSQTSITIVNSTLSGNRALAGQGGGLYNDGDEVILKHSTVVENQAASGGGVASAGKAAAATRIGHSIVSHNGNHDLAVAGGTVNSFTSLGYNIIGTGADYGAGGANATDPFTADATNLIGIDPKLGPLLDNGARTLTHALAPDSPAVNAGDPNVVVPFPRIDQRFEPRVFGGRVDIGAYEINVNPIVVTNLDDSGPGSLRQAILDANGNGFRVEDAMFSPTASQEPSA
jgi:hypothetical protein